MKKFLALLMTVAMVLSLVAVPTLADIPEDEVCFFIDDYTANAGDTITVPVLIYNYEGNAHGLAMHVTYDPSVLEVTNVTRGDWLTNALLEVGATVIIDYTTLAEEGKIAIGMMCPTDPAPAAASPETIINISFTVKADAVPGTYDFGYWFPETAAFFNMPVGATTGTDIPHTDIAGQLTVEGEVPPVDPTEPPVSDTGWYFETDPEDEGWYWLDEDGDGNEWQWMLGAVEMNIPEGEGMMNSQSYINYVGPVTPDNWLVSPVFEAGTQVSFMMVGQDPAYAAEYIGVYVSVDGGETWSDEIAGFTATGEVTTYFVDTATYAGQMICVAFRHYNVTDMFSVNLDAVEVLGRGTVDPTEPPVDPTEPPVEPTLPPIGELPSFVVDNYYAQVGDVIEIPVVLYAYEGNAHVLNMWLDYDPAALQINSITYGEFITNAQGLGGMVVLDYTTVPGSIRLGVVDPQNDPIPAGSEPMVIYTINATVLEGAAETNVLDITVNEFKNYPIGGTVTLIEHYVYDGAVIIGEEPTEPPVEPTEPPVEPTEPPVEPTPTPAPVPGTGAATLIGLGVMALLSGAGVVLFRKKED